MTDYEWMNNGLIYMIFIPLALLWLAALKAKKLTGDRLPHTEPHEPCNTTECVTNPHVS